MHTRGNTRQFSLRSFLLWVLLLSLSFTLFRVARDLDSGILLVCGIGCVCSAVVIALVALQRCWKHTILAFLSALCIYAGVYIGLSLNGRYEPACWGPSGVKWYEWAPAGFVRDYEWNERLMLTFAPLYYLDSRFWHRFVGQSYSGRYAINRDPD
jgi:hypothetical protein